jgi:hypothetical protein
MKTIPDIILRRMKELEIRQPFLPLLKRIKIRREGPRGFSVTCGRTGNCSRFRLLF